MIKRKGSDETRSSIPSMATRKRPSRIGITGAILLMIAILVFLVIAIQKLPSPLGAEPIPDLTKIVFSTETRTSITSTTSTLTPSPSLSPSPSSTATATRTQTPTATRTSTPTETPKPMPFVIRGTPQALTNELFHPEYDCEDYLFIGGQVWDLQDAPVLGVIVHLGGTYGGDLVDLDVASGSDLVYGASGYEFALTNKQIAEDNLYIELRDKNGEPLSAPTSLQISPDCNANLIIVNYKQVR